MAARDRESGPSEDSDSDVSQYECIVTKGLVSEFQKCAVMKHDHIIIVALLSSSANIVQGEIFKFQEF